MNGSRRDVEISWCNISDCRDYAYRYCDYCGAGTCGMHTVSVTNGSNRYMICPPCATTRNISFDSIQDNE